MESELHVNVWHSSEMAIHKVETDEETGEAATAKERPNGVRRNKNQRTQPAQMPTKSKIEHL